MKLLIPFFLLFLISCKKEITMPVVIEAAQLPSQFETVYLVDDYNTYNLCTSEYLHITGSIRLLETVKIKGSDVDYTYSSDYDNLDAVGLTTGNHYKGRGQNVNRMSGYLTNGVFTLTNATINNKLTFALQGSGNDLYTTVIQHIKVNADGSATVVNSNFEINSCK